MYVRHHHHDKVCAMMSFSPTYLPTYLSTASTCPIITLIPSALYALKRPITVRRSVTLIGRPVGFPEIDAHGR